MKVQLKSMKNILFVLRSALTCDSTLSMLQSGRTKEKQGYKAPLVVFSSDSPMGMNLSSSFHGDMMEFRYTFKF